MTTAMIMAELERRRRRRKRDHSIAWKLYREYADYPDIGVRFRFEEKASRAAARLDEVRLIQNALRRMDR